MKIILLFLFLFCACDQSPRYRDEVIHISPDGKSRITNATTYFRNGKLSDIGGFPVITVKGTPYEAGLQYGVLLKDKIREFYHQIELQIENKTKGSVIKKFIAKIIFWYKIKKIRSRMGPEILQELRGIQDGTQMSQFQIDIIAFFPQIFFDISCSSLVIKQNNSLIHGRNLDWAGIGAFTPYAIITRYEINGQIPYLNFSYVGYPGLYTGINQKGLSLAVNMNGSTPDRDDYNRDIPIPYKMREILAKAKSLEQVEQLLRNYHSHAWFITTASANDNKGAIFELVRGELIIDKMVNDHIAITNISLARKSLTEYSPITQHNSSNYSRTKQIKKILKGNKQKSVLLRTFDVLSDIGWHNLPHTPHLTHSLNGQRTVQSIIFDNKKLQSHFSFAPNHAAGKTFLRYDFKEDKIRPSRKSLPYFQTKKYQKIVECYNKTCPKTIEYYHKNKNFKKALIENKKLLQKFPGFPYLSYRQADLLVELNQSQDAIKVLNNLLSQKHLAPYSRYKGLIQAATITKKINPKKSMKLLEQAKKLASQYYLDSKIIHQLEEKKK